MYDYYDVEKMMKTYKENYRVLRSKHKPRLSEIEIKGHIDENTRKKLIKEIWRTVKNV